MQPDNLGGRLPLLDPAKLSETQREVYDLANSTMVPWAEAAHFQSKTADGRLIGPFNPVLFAPEMATCFSDLQAAEARHTPLSERVRQVVILAVGAVWKADYELYAHSAVARKAGLSEAAIRSLASGGDPQDDLSDEERIAQRFVRQLTGRASRRRAALPGCRSGVRAGGTRRHDVSGRLLPSRLLALERVRNSRSHP